LAGLSWRSPVAEGKLGKVCGESSFGGVSWWAELLSESPHGGDKSDCAKTPAISSSRLLLPPGALQPAAETETWSDFISRTELEREGDEACIGSIVRNTFIHVASSASEQGSSRRRSRSLPKDIGSSKSRLETTCHALLSPRRSRTRVSTDFTPTNGADTATNSKQFCSQVSFQRLSDVDVGSTVQVLIDVVTVLQACRKAGIGQANDQQRIATLGKIGTVLKKDPRDDTVKISLPPPLGILWYPVAALMPVTEVPFQSLNEVQIGASVQVLSDSNIVLCACLNAGIGSAKDEKRIACLGRTGVVLSRDPQDGTVKCSIAAVGDLWLPFAAIMPLQELAKLPRNSMCHPISGRRNMRFGSR